MAEVSDQAVNEIVQRVTAQVFREMKGHEEQVFGVADLRGYVTELGRIGGDLGAWKISYDTKREASIEALGGRPELGRSAWKISYDTKRSPEIVDRTVERSEEG